MEKKQLMEFQRTQLRLKLEKFIMLGLWLDYCPEIYGKTYIYGAGILGKLVLRCFKNKPKSFIDVKNGLDDINGVPVLCLKNCKSPQFDSDDTIIVTPVWEFDEIKRNLLNIKYDINIVSLEKLMERI